MTGQRDPSLAHLFGRLAVVEARVRAAVDHFRASDPAPDDPFRGLYISDDHIERILAGDAASTWDETTLSLLERVEMEADTADSEGARLRLREMTHSFGLDQVDIDLLLVSLAPDLDRRFEKFYGYLNDDVTRQRPSIGLALELCGMSPQDAHARRRFSSHAPLVSWDIVRVGEPDRPFLTRPLGVPDRIAGHLLGDDSVDPLIHPVLFRAPDYKTRDFPALPKAIKADTRLVYIVDQPDSQGRLLAIASLERSGISTIVLDLLRLPPDSVRSVATIADREARLCGGVVVAGPIDALQEGDPSAVRTFAELESPTVLIGSRFWDPSWSNRVPLVFDLPPLSQAERAGFWRVVLEANSDNLDLAKVTSTFRLGPEQIARAARSAQLHATAADRLIQPVDLVAGARAQNAGGLERLARRIDAAMAWNELVLPKDVLDQLRQLCVRIRHRDRMLGHPTASGLLKGGSGVAALFAGPSGTGKTMAAEVIASELGLVLYTIDLSTIVDKYVGETERNLDRLFREAQHVNGVLFFDEADALFGKRTEVRNAHDRFANIEMAYLLQRMEHFDGIAILATNLRANIDEAFARRLDMAVDFPLPDARHRLLLWRMYLGSLLEMPDSLDLDFCAHAFALSGANIRNVALSAAFLAADEDRPILMCDVIEAVRAEYRKLGRLCIESEFGQYADVGSYLQDAHYSPTLQKTSS